MEELCGGMHVAASGRTHMVSRNFLAHRDKVVWVVEEDLGSGRAYGFGQGNGGTPVKEADGLKVLGGDGHSGR